MKRMIILCDGTGQSADRGETSVSTNVNRFVHALETNAHNEQRPTQLIFYQSGIGTDDIGRWTSGILGALSSSFGYGVEDRVLDAYNFIMNNYCDGDEIFIFGFSRGAFIARVLANFIARLGVFCKLNFTWKLKDAWKEYLGGAESFNKHLEELKTKESMRTKENMDEAGPWRTWPKIKVVGCWDTVASVGLPIPMFNSEKIYAYLDGSLVSGIEHAFHALSLDEVRRPFSPTMWFLPENEAAAATIDLRQVWFPGVHTNVGGGYPDQALADLALAWMIDLCSPYLDFSDKYISVCVQFNHNPKDVKSEHRKTHPDGMDLEWQGWACGKLYDSWWEWLNWDLTRTWWRTRTPGQYAAAQKARVGASGERMHASVRERWTKMPNWRPKALAGFVSEQHGGKWVWVMKSKGGEALVVIEEEPFDAPEHSFEWRLRNGTSAGEPSVSKSRSQ